MVSEYESITDCIDDDGIYIEHVMYSLYIRHSLGVNLESIAAR